MPSQGCRTAGPPRAHSRLVWPGGPSRAQLASPAPPRPPAASLPALAGVQRQRLHLYDVDRERAAKRRPPRPPRASQSSSASHVHVWWVVGDHRRALGHLVRALFSVRHVQRRVETHRHGHMVEVGTKAAKGVQETWACSALSRRFEPPPYARSDWKNCIDCERAASSLLELCQHVGDSRMCRLCSSNQA